MREWLHTPSAVLGLPHWAVVFFATGAIVEYVLGRSSNPRFRSLAHAMAALIGILVKPTIGRLPALGPVVVHVLDAVAPPPERKCSACGGSGLEAAPPAPPAEPRP